MSSAGARVQNPARLAAATGHLARVAGLRMFRSRATIVNALLLALAIAACVAGSLHRERSAAWFTTHVFLPLYVSFLLPISCLGYASAAIAGDRQERTLVYLLATPLPRPLVFLGKYIAATLLVLGWNLAGSAAICRAAGSPGWQAWQAYWPVVVWASLAYAGLFLLFSVLFQRATVISLGYALFLETFLGNMPGIVKRLAISFYAQCLVFERGAALGVPAGGGRSVGLFQPVDGDTARLVLGISAASFFALGLWLFSRREYA